MNYRIVSRSEWGARPARNRTTIARSRRRTFVVHYEGPATNRTGRTIPQSIQRYHMDSNGWADIGYNFVVSQAGEIFEGRGWDTLGAHAGSAGNVEGIGVQVHIGGNQQPTQAALRALVWLKGEADRLTGRTLAWKKHNDYMSTSCPGKPLIDWLAAGRPLAGSPPEHSARYVRPVDARHRVTAAYGIPGSWQAGHHTGIDFGCPTGTPIYAVAEGDVRDRGRLLGPDYGTVVTINEDDTSGGAGAGSDWHYCHCSRVVVTPGQRVKAGDLIAYSGNTGRSTGPHLHLERRPRMGGYGTDRDPVLWDDAPADTSPPTEDEDDLMAERRVTTTRFQHPGGWMVPPEKCVPADPDHPLLITHASAHIIVPEGVELRTRWVSDSGNRAMFDNGWVRYPTIPHSLHVCQATRELEDQAWAGSDLQIDIWVSEPCEVHMRQTALWHKKSA